MAVGRRQLLVVALLLGGGAACTAFASDDSLVPPTDDGGRADGDDLLDGGSPTAAPSVFASGQLNPTSVTPDGMFVYWTNPVDLGSVMRCPIAGCGAAPTPLASEEARPDSVLASP